MEDSTGWNKKSKILITNLMVMGELDTGVKLNTRNSCFSLDTTSPYQGIGRTIRGDNRDATYDKVADLIQDVHNLIGNIEMNDQEFIDILIKAKKGLEYLRETYQDDKTFSAKLKVEIGILGRLIDKCKHLVNYQEDPNYHGEPVSPEAHYYT